MEKRIQKVMCLSAALGPGRDAALACGFRGLGLGSRIAQSRIVKLSGGLLAAYNRWVKAAEPHMNSSVLEAGPPSSATI